MFRHPKPSPKSLAEGALGAEGNKLAAGFKDFFFNVHLYLRGTMIQCDEYFSKQLKPRPGDELCFF